MKFDFPEVDTRTLSNEGVTMNVRRLNSDQPLIARNGQPVTLRLLGPDSDVYRSATRAQVQKRLSRADNTKKLSEVDFEEYERDSLDMLAAVTVGWENVLTPDGEPIPFSTENVRSLYAAYPVVREQVDAFVANRAHFLKASLKN
jgi:hypothetical protein